MNFRLFVEKKSDFRVEEQNLFNEMKESIGIKDLENVRVLNIYDIFNTKEKELEKLKTTVFSEKNIDKVYDSFEKVFLEEKVVDSNSYFAVEFLPGQYDQRADSAIQCISLLIDNDKNLAVKSGKLIILYQKIIIRLIL